MKTIERAIVFFEFEVAVEGLPRWRTGYEPSVKMVARDDFTDVKETAFHKLSINPKHVHLLTMMRNGKTYKVGFVYGKDAKPVTITCTRLARW